MVKKVVTDADIGAGLKIEAGKLLVEVDNSTIKIVDNQLVATSKVDLRVTAITPEEGKLKITVADENGENAQTVETTLAKLIVLSQAEGNLAEAKDDGIFVGKAKVVEAAKEAATEEVRSLGGVTLGFMFPPTSQPQ
ncbi:hypothetical protein [Haemophilus parahaemolyticus]|uniref:hypothetical protein n=1 Tax=Haemophilus parahaemolyticus TaxID=735 RepID=UPI002491BC5F|nr:hypothetical protein [Haemophilus parahaemolyticus]